MRMTSLNGSSTMLIMLSTYHKVLSQKITSLLLIMDTVKLITRKYSFIIQDMKGLLLDGKLYGNKTFL